MALRLAVLGCAHIHMADAAEAIEADPRAQVTGLWDHDGDRADYWARRLGAPQAAEPTDALTDADATIVMSETIHHPALVATAADAGTDLFVEKPLARSVPEAAAVRAAIERADVRFDTGYLLREVDAHQRIRELVADGALGTPVRARACFAHPGALAGWFEDYPWTTDPEAAGFGGFGDEGVHAIDLLTWTLGRSIAAGTAVISRVTEGARIDESGEALVQLTDGTPATLTGGWTEPAMTSELSVTGTAGRARAIDGELVIETPHESSRNTASAPDSRQTVARFLAAVAGESPSTRVSLEAAETHCRVLEGLYRAAADGTWADLQRP